MTASGGTNSANTLYTYQAGPTVTSISPTSGPLAGGQSVTITGAGFTGATVVTIGGTAATAVTVVSSTSITATTPAGSAGTASVLVTASGGTNSANTLYTYQAVPRPVVPAVTSTGPLFHTGATQTITLRFSHPAGIAELGILNALINRALDGGNACYIAFSQPQRVLYLVNNAGPDVGLSSPLTLGSSGSVSNSQCTIFSAGSSVSSTNTELTLTLNIAFSSTFSGNRVIYLAARSVTEQNSGWQPQGVSALPETTPPFPRSGVLSPAVGTTAAATLTATFLDATNATNIQTTWLLINSAVNADRACYVAYFRPGNLLLLFPDSGDGNLATAMPLSGSGFLENSQCRIDAQGSSVTVVGNALTLNLNTVFKPSFAGPRIIFGALNSSAVNSLWKPLGAWQVPP